jgi:hypothetical protein
MWNYLIIFNGINVDKVDVRFMSLLMPVKMIYLIIILDLLLEI